MEEHRLKMLDMPKVLVCLHDKYMKKGKTETEWLNFSNLDIQHCPKNLPLTKKINKENLSYLNGLKKKSH